MMLMMKSELDDGMEEGVRKMEVRREEKLLSEGAADYVAWWRKHSLGLGVH